MESTLQALGGILLRAVPTLLLVLFLHVYLKRVFFIPLEAVLRKRREATEGAREAADAALKRADAAAARYQQSLESARSGIYKDQEDTRKRWLEEQSGTLEQSRSKARDLVGKAKNDIAAEVAAAREELSKISGSIASQISQRLLSGRVN